jgi:hypothetical protein
MAGCLLSALSGRRRTISACRLLWGGYSNATPIFVSVLHSERQCRRVPSITTSKFFGIPMVVDTCKPAPVSEIFLIVHSSFGACSVIMMKALLSTRLRAATRFSFTIAIPPKEGSAALASKPSSSKARAQILRTIYSALSPGLRAAEGDRTIGGLLAPADIARTCSHVR